MSPFAIQHNTEHGIPLGFAATGKALNSFCFSTIWDASARSLELGTLDLIDIRLATGDGQPGQTALQYGKEMAKCWPWIFT